MNQSTALFILKEAYSACQNIFDSSFDCYLYGSYARGDFDDESDVNILLVVDEDYQEIHNKDRQCAHVSSELSLRFDITVNIAVAPLELFNNPLFFIDVKNEGIKFQ